MLEEIVEGNALIIALKIEEVKLGTYYQFRDPNRYRTKNGQLLKRCVCCRVFKDVSQFYWTSTRTTWFTHCKPCHNTRLAIKRYGSVNARTVPWVQVRPFFIELVNRVGRAETARRIGVARSMVTKYMTDPPIRVLRRTAEAILVQTQEARSRGEVRHRLSILSGAQLRGRPMRQVDPSRDLYRPHGDNNAEARQRERLRTVGR